MDKSLQAALLCAAFILPGQAMASSPPTAKHDDHAAANSVNTENVFGTLTGSDLLPVGAVEVSSDTMVRLGKLGGQYRGIDQRLSVAYGATSWFSASLASLGSAVSVKRVEGLEDTNRAAMPGGVGGELRLRLIDRAHAPVGVTVSVAPGWKTIDARSGMPATVVSVESMLSIDTALVPDTLFGAINLVHGLEHGKERDATAWSDGSTLGAGVALSYRVLPNVFVGGEVRYLRAYEGTLAGRYAGDGIFAGPSVQVQITHNAWASLSWSMQVRGHEASGASRLNLTDFERNQVRLKVGFEF